jgi:hypothetical protein
MRYNEKKNAIEKTKLIEEFNIHQAFFINILTPGEIR